MLRSHFTICTRQKGSENSLKTIVKSRAVGNSCKSGGAIVLKNREQCIQLMTLTLHHCFQNYWVVEAYLPPASYRPGEVRNTSWNIGEMRDPSRKQNTKIRSVKLIDTNSASCNKRNTPFTTHTELYVD